MQPVKRTGTRGRRNMQINKQTKEEFLKDYWDSVESIPDFVDKDWFDAVPCPHCPDCGEWLLVFKKDK